MSANAAVRRRSWVALATSLALHAVLLASLGFVPVPVDLAVDETVLPVTLLHIEKRVPPVPRAGTPTVEAAAPHRANPQAVIAHAAVAAPPANRARPHAGPAGRRSHAHAAPRPAPTTAPAGGGRVEPPDASGSAAPSPEPMPTLNAEMLARVNVAMHDALPSAMPQTMKDYGSGLASLHIPPRPRVLTAANYPLPLSGLFTHARVARTEHEAIAVRAIQRIGRGYICIGYLAKVPAHGEPLAGPYVGACKRAWLAQLGLQATPPAASAAPSAEPTAPGQPTTHDG